MNATPNAGAVRAAMVAALVLALGLLPPAIASAQTPDPRQPVALAVAGPEDVALGNLARIVARLQDGAGQPIGQARIVFTSPTAFIGTIGEMTIGEAVTDATGVATLDYQLRSQGRNQIIARFHGDDAHQPAEATTVVLATDPVQLTQRTAGVRVPLLSPWALIAVLGAVWVVYFIALLLVAGIPEQPGRPVEPEGRTP